MKKYIAATSKRNALALLYDQCVKQGLKCAKNAETHCIDILDDDDNVIEQWYPTRSGYHPSTRYGYIYAGKGKGDYQRIVRSVKESDYDGDPYIKYVYMTNDPADTRRNQQ